jgi:hypothetical protein
MLADAMATFGEAAPVTSPEPAAPSTAGGGGQTDPVLLAGGGAAAVVALLGVWFVARRRPRDA